MEPLECADWCRVWEKEQKSNMLRNFYLKYWEKRDLTIIQISCSFKSLHGLSLASFLKNRALKSHTTHSCILIFHLCQVLISELSHILFLWPETLFLLLLTSLTSLTSLFLIYLHTFLKSQLWRDSDHLSWETASAMSSHSILPLAFYSTLTPP